MHGLAELNDFYNICKKIVKGYPPQYIAVNEPEMVALRPNTFAVVRSLKDFDAENINKRPQFVDSPYFFSRHFDNAQYRSGDFKTEYPIVGFAEDTTTLKLVRSDVAKLNFFFIDQIPQHGNFYEDTYSKNREIEHVAKDIRDHFRRFIGVLRQFAYCKIQNDELVEGWYDTTWLFSQGYRYTDSVRLDSLINFDNLTVEIFPSIVDNCLIGLTNIFVNLDDCSLDIPVIDYLDDAEMRYTNDAV